MTRYNVFRLKNHALLMALAAVYPLTASAAGAAKVDFAVGTVNVVAASGAQRPATKGTELESGDTLVTGNGGRAQLRFSDGGMVSLQPGSEYRIDDYRFSGSQDGSEKGIFSLVKGGLRTITGQVGRNNKAAYRVNTSVATIGIRGTEFTIAYMGASSIAVATGEGAVEVCNKVGCVILPSGASAIVNGPDTRIERSEVRPRLDPAQPDDTRLAVFSTSDARQENGSIAPVSTPMVSRSGYAVTYVAAASQPATLASATAAFDNASLLQSFSGGTTSLSATQIAGGFTADGIIGWGRWVSGGGETGFPATPLDVQQMHYVVGTPTGLGGLSGTAIFSANGNGTNATHVTAGGQLIVGGVATGTMNVDFSASTGQITNLSLSIPINGGALALTGTSIDVQTNGTFSDASTGTYAGFFAGANASHAGLTYKVNGGGVGLGGDVTGSVVFSR